MILTHFFFNNTDTSSSLTVVQQFIKEYVILREQWSITGNFFSYAISTWSKRIQQSAIRLRSAHTTSTVPLGKVRGRWSLQCNKNFTHTRLSLVRLPISLFWSISIAVECTKLHAATAYGYRCLIGNVNYWYAASLSFYRRRKRSFRIGDSSIFYALATLGGHVMRSTLYTDRAPSRLAVSVRYLSPGASVVCLAPNSYDVTSTPLHQKIYINKNNNKIICHGLLVKVVTMWFQPWLRLCRAARNDVLDAHKKWNGCAKMHSSIAGKIY